MYFQRNSSFPFCTNPPVLSTWEAPYGHGPQTDWSIQPSPKCIRSALNRATQLSDIAMLSNFSAHGCWKPKCIFPLTDLPLIIFFLPQIVEVTLLIASYINYCALTPLLSPAPPSLNIISPLSTTPTKKLWETQSQCFFPSMPRTTKGPTLLWVLVLSAFGF